ncbi:MAG: hypothetical protein R3281_18835 [Balneolaceae bacterium]|nr:hypothetical protein [Balneolaceae bacterium]
MPTVSRTFIKSGLIWFFFALTCSLTLEMDWLNAPVLRPLYWHMLMVGWITQIIFGVSLWMFPGRSRSDAFREHLKEWMTFGLLNSGLVLRVLSEPMAGRDLLFWDTILVLSAVLQWGAAVTYLMELWPRVLSKKKRLKQVQKMRKRKEV